MRGHAELATRCWYPQDHGPLFEVRAGINVEVLIGEPAFQLTSGEIVTL